MIFLFFLIGSHQACEVLICISYVAAVMAYISCRHAAMIHIVPVVVRFLEGIEMDIAIWI